MKKIYLVFLLTILIVPIAKAETIHNINLEGDKIIINSTLVLKSEKILDYWEVTIPLPDNSSIISVKDEVGDINYSLFNNKLTFKTNLKKSKIRIINIIYSKPTEKKYGFNFIDLSLFGFKNESTIIIAPSFQYFFVPNAEIEYGKIIKARGKGPLNAKILFGGKKESEHYFTNSNLNLEEIEKYYWVVEGITGLKIPIKFGIVVLSEKEYKGSLEKWSAGTFEDGLIIVRKDLNEKSKIATIMHETIHGFNSFALDWDKTDISWFDEGVATYVSSVIFRILNETKPEIFGEEIKWKEGNKIYILEPNHKPEDLLEYYKRNENWMLYWNPRKYNDERREFGYAYSELFIREFLKENASALHKVYKDLLKINKSVEDENERNKIILGILGKEFKPCYFLNLEKIKNCTKELNDMIFGIPKVNGKEINYKIEIPKLPEVKDFYISPVDLIIQKVKEFFDFLIQMIANFLRI
jgi:hypothetical protein